MVGVEAPDGLDVLTDVLLREGALELESIMEQAQESRHYGLDVNLLVLLDREPDLAYKIFREPATMVAQFEVAMLRAQTRILTTRSGAAEGLRAKREVHPRFSGIPLCPETFYKRIPGAEVAGRLIAVCGTVTRLGAIRIMDKSRTFQCAKCHKKTAAKPDDTQFGVISKPAFCAAVVDDVRCPSTKFDPCDESLVEREDYQEVRIQEMTSLLEMPRSLAVVLRHDLVDFCKAGDELVVLGWIVSRWRPVKSGARFESEFCLVANNVFISNQRSASFADQVDAGDFAAKFWAAHRDSPLRGRDVLVGSFCPQIFGLHLVKLAVVLTIVGGCSDEEEGGASGAGGGDSGRERGGEPEGSSFASRKYRKEGHLLLVGDPGTAKSQFLVSAAKISTRSVITTGSGSTNAGLTVAAVKESGEWQLEAGALVLADRGICCIDEFNSLRPHDRTAIHEAMEQQTLSIAKAGLVCKLQTRCSIVAACNAKGKFEEAESISSNVALASPLLSRFDMIIVMTDRRSEEWDRSLSASILAAAGKQGSRARYCEGYGTSVDFETLRSYVNHVRGGKKPGMSAGGRVVLGKYYQLQRRSDIRDAARTTIRLLESLIRMAQAHAKLMYQESVEISDAVWAIVLMETSLATQSMLGVRPDVYAVPSEDPAAQYLNDYEAFILRRLDINPKVLNYTDLALDDEADRILCSWQATQINTG